MGRTLRSGSAGAPERAGRGAAAGPALGVLLKLQN